MRYIILLLIALPAFAANYPNQVSVLLDAGATSLTVHNSGSGGSDLVFPVKVLGSGHRYRFTISTISVPPKVTDTYTTCADPCTVNINRNWGQQYYWTEEVAGAGTTLGIAMSVNLDAYTRHACGGIGTLPQVELSTVTTNPMPMPVEVIGQDCYVTRLQFPLESGHASTSLRFYLRIHSSGYNSPPRPDGKISIQINSGAWITLTNAVATAIDEQRFYSDDLVGIGSFPQVREFTLPIPDGTISGGDTTVTIGVRFNGTEGIGSGSRILSLNIIEANKSCASLAVTSNVTTITCASNGFTNANTVLIQNAPGIYMRHNGLRTISNKTTNTFDYTPCGTGTAGCTSPNATGVAPPVNYDASGYSRTVQTVMYAARCIIPKSAFTDWTPDTTGPVGGVAATGANWFLYGNAAGTPAQTDQLVNPVLPYLNNALHNATCGGATGCHTSTGSDLKYFNYSNRAIMERARFHGVTDQGLLDIAAYIRELPIGVPSKGRPWNPPLQPGPGLSKVSWSRAIDTLSVAVTTNTAVATLPSGHGMLVGEPLCITNETVDTDLNGCYILTAVGATTATFTTVSVANGTYTATNLIAASPAKFFAGCGADCLLTFGDDIQEYMPSSSTWGWDSRVEPRDLPLPYQFGGWAQWLPVVHPADAWTNATTPFFSHASYTNYRDIIDNMASSSFSAFQAKNYGRMYLTNTSGGFFQFMFTSIGDPFNGKVKNGNFNNWTTNYFGVMQYSLKAMYEVAVDKNTFCFDGQRIAAQNGGSATPNPNWPISCGIKDNTIFETGWHKIHLDYGAGMDVLPTTFSGTTFNVQSNAWYLAQYVLNGGNGYGQYSNPIDTNYSITFIRHMTELRPGGFTALLYPEILTPQAGGSWPEFASYDSVGENGLDWQGWWERSSVGTSARNEWAWMSPTQQTAWANNFLLTLNQIISSKSTAYWIEAFTNHDSAYVGAACCDVADTLSNSTLKPGSHTVMYLTLFKQAGVDAGQFATLLAWAKAVFSIKGDAFWNAQAAAGIAGDSEDHGTIASISPGPITITYSTLCPTQHSYGSYVTITGSGGAGTHETLPTTGGTCVGGGTGTLTFTATIAQSGTIQTYVDCAVAAPWPRGAVLAGTPFALKCGNMY